MARRWLENKPNLGGNTSLIHLPGVGERLLLPPFFPLSIQKNQVFTFFMCGFGLPFLPQPKISRQLMLVGFVNDFKFFSFYYNVVINLWVKSFELWEMMKHSCSKGYQTFWMSFSLLSCPAMLCNHIRLLTLLMQLSPFGTHPGNQHWIKASPLHSSHPIWNRVQPHSLSETRFTTMVMGEKSTVKELLGK